MDEVLERLPGGFLAFGDDSIVRTTNASLRAMLGYLPGEIEGKHVETLLTVPSRIFHQTHVFPLLKMQGHIGEVYLSARSKTGEEIPVLINGSRVLAAGEALNECLLIPMRRRNEYEDEILRAKRTAEEATGERERMHAALLSANAALERQREELVARNVELEALKESLEERVVGRTAELTNLIHELEGFNYSIAHDLRTPLRAIIAVSDILTTQECDGLSDDQIHLLQRQKHNAVKLASLLEDLLRLSRLGLQPIAAEPVDLSALAQEAALATLVDQNRSNIVLSIEPNVSVRGDRAMLSTAIQNLMENAVKYSPNRGVVSFGSTLVEGERAYFVKDEGMGIDPAHAHRIFLPFERLHREGDIPGNGIGLANVERVVRRHGGRIWVQSRPGEGSTFFFTLPG